MLRFISSVSLVAAATFASSAFAEQTIKIVSASPLSGEQASLGSQIKDGAQIAIEEAQPAFAKMGFKLELAPQDDQANPDTGVAVAKRIVNDNEVLGVVGHFNSGVGLPASEVYKDFNLVMVSPANTNPKITDRGYANVNRVCGRDDVQGPAGSEFATGELKAKKIFIIHDKTAYGQGVAEAFRDTSKKSGAAVLSFSGTEEKSDFTSLTQQIKALKPDLIYFGGVYSQGGPLLKQIRDAGLKAYFLGPDGLDSSDFVKLAGASAKGAYFTTVAGPVDKYPKAAKFAAAFKTKFNHAPESFALYSYDSARVILEATTAAIKANGGKMPTREAVSKEVRKVNFEGITGTIAFDSKGDRKKSDYYIMSLKEGIYPGVVEKVVSVAPPQAAK